MAFIVPPGGFAGHAQMTPASRAAFGKVGGTSAKRRRSRVNRKNPEGSDGYYRAGRAKSRRAKKVRTRGGRKMKFGSPAWQKKYKVGKFRK